VSSTVAFELRNNLALTQKVSLAVADMALDLSEAFRKDCPLHAPCYPFCGDGGKRPAFSMQKSTPCGEYKQRQCRGERQTNNDGHGVRETFLHAIPQTCKVTGSARLHAEPLNGGSYAYTQDCRLFEQINIWLMCFVPYVGHPDSVPAAETPFAHRKSGAEQNSENPKNQDNDRYSNNCGDDVLSFVSLNISSEHALENALIGRGLPTRDGFV